MPENDFRPSFCPLINAECKGIDCVLYRCDDCAFSIFVHQLEELNVSVDSAADKLSESIGGEISRLNTTLEYFDADFNDK